MTQLRRLLVGAIALAFAGLPALALAESASPATATTADTKPVVIFAAASLKNAIDEIAKAWEAKSGGKATSSFASSSALAKQIESGAPADIFISANVKWMDWLAERKLINDASRKTLLGNTLVLIAPKESTAAIKIENGFKLADAIGDGRIAMGEVSSVPAGIYGKAALTSLGVWADVAPKVAGAQNVRIALAYVSRGETPFGIVYGTDAKSDANIKVIDTFPAGSHEPIEYPVAITASSSNPAAKAFLDYLATPEAAAVFESKGFVVLK